MKKLFQAGGILLLGVIVSWLWFKNSTLFVTMNAPSTELSSTDTPITVPEDWLTYQGEFFTFKYPPSLEAFESYETIWFVPQGETAKALKCMKDGTGTIDHPCIEKMVFSLAVGKQDSDYLYGLRRQVSPENGLLLDHYPDNQRTWQYLLPIEGAGATNLDAQLVGEAELYNVSLQVGRNGYEQYVGGELTEGVFLDFTKKLLSSFTFDEPEKKPYFSNIVCTGQTIRDYDVGFSMVCPEGMHWYVTRDHYDPYLDKQTKIINICEGELDSKHQNSYRCLGGGLMVWANGDGWGGGCDPKDHSAIMLNGETKTLCLYEEGADQLYVGQETDPHRFYLGGSFTDTFPKDDALRTLKTFTLTGERND